LFGRKDTSYSNIECLNADPIVYFPNAIQINGFNTSFYPKGVFIDYTKSSYQIYNRWGQLVFETDNIQTQWFGTYNYSVVESEVFAYKATIVGLNGTIKYYDGTIIVLK
jgi:gliding motility-associated-like protein